MKNLYLGLMALLLAALAGCQIVTDPGDEGSGFACLFDANHNGIGAFVGFDPQCNNIYDVREMESLSEVECRTKARQGWDLAWTATSPIDFNDANGVCNDDDPTPTDDDDDTPADDDDATDNNPNDWDHVLSLDWTMSGNSYARLLLGGNPPNLPFQIFANVVDRDRVNVDLYMNSSNYDQFEWLVLGFNDEARYQSWLDCANGDDPVNECWTLVDFESCTGDADSGEAFPVGNHQARWQNSGRTVSFRANPYDGCIAVVN